MVLARSDGVLKELCCCLLKSMIVWRLQSMPQACNCSKKKSLHVAAMLTVRAQRKLQQRESWQVHSRGRNLP